MLVQGKHIMAIVFISYSSKDIDFAQLCSAMLKTEGIDTWIDHGSIHGGDEWRESIDEGIQSSDAVVVVISPYSNESSYVTYEWAFALGQDVKIIPILLKKTNTHPRLSTIHHFDFTNPLSRPWGDLIEEIKRSSDTSEAQPANRVPDLSVKADINDAKDRILEYLDEKGFRMMSFQRIRENIDHRYNDDFLAEVIAKNRHILLKAKLRGNKPGVKKAPGANN
jgi:hypothetical protein